ncbi:ACP S-malonyltransferase [Tundrisphaera lichenicola]|uniref:ACP S-malonyltransferase n=1 Tax=Tundrisphaera lichenicola TaxID=2029860 RepID=UPI003EBCAA63
MKDSENRWLRRKSLLEVDLSKPALSASKSGRMTGGSTPVSKPSSPADLRRRMNSTVIAFRGFDVDNLGRSIEFLDHPRFGPIVLKVLDEASILCSDAIHTKVDLASHIRAGLRSNLDFFPQDVATIVAMELAQLEILEECFEVNAHEARLSFGYSIGELSALVFGGVYSLEQLLPIPLALAPDCAELAADLTMGVLFTRGPALPMDEVERLCRAISSEGKGLIGPSAFLSPNTALILGQGDTIDRLDESKGEIVAHKGHKVLLRRNSNRWPPLHSPLVWQRSIPNRTAISLYRTGGGVQKPTPMILSCVTGDASYTAGNSREILTDWTDHPQRLWDVIDRTLAMGSDVVVHVGPRPNLIPSTFTRLANNVGRYLGHPYMKMIGRGVASGLGRNAWLGRILPSSTTLLRAPYLSHVILEDWLLEQPISTVSVRMTGTSLAEGIPPVEELAG